MTVTPTRTRASIEADIAAKRAQQDRMPVHWHDRREKLGAEIDRLVDQWIAASA